MLIVEAEVAVAKINYYDADSKEVSATTIIRFTYLPDRIMQI